MGIVYGIEELPQRNERYEVLRNDVVENADVCVIGSGAAGAVLVKELAESGRSVVLLERGGYYEGKDMNQRDADMVPLLWKNGGFSFDDNLRILIAQGSCLGGSTIINDAVCFDPPDRVKAEWRSLGVDFTDKEWSAHVERVNRILSVTEVSDAEMNRNNRMLKVGAEKIGLRDHRKNRRNCVNCMQCGFCHLGCHYETKQNVLVTYLHEALGRPDSQVRIYCNCYASRIAHEDGIARGVEGEFRDAEGRPVYRIHVNAKVVVLSAGAIASTKLLLQNGIAQQTAGRGLCLHPAPFVLGDFDYEIKGNQGVPMAYTVHDFGVTRKTDEIRDQHNFRDGEFLLESVFLPLLQFSLSIPAGVAEQRDLLQRFNHYTMAGVLVRDGNNGRVALTPTGRASLTYELKERERRIIAKGVEVLGRMWFALGASRIVTSHRNQLVVEREEDIPKLVDAVLSDPAHLVLGSAHPQSGNRIGRGPEDSVVDSNCRVHGFRNLFVCDASVFPTAIGVNPQITVMSVASIVASRIAQAWKDQYSRLPVSQTLGNTCAIGQPMFCGREALSSMFTSFDTLEGADVLVNDPAESANENNWWFDQKSRMITNNTHWRGFFPRDQDISNTLTLYFGGFWKRFSRGDAAIQGITHPFEVPVFAPNRATNRELPGFGKSILLEYSDPPFQQFFDVLKVVDQNTLLGQAFFLEPKPGRQMLTFSMARKYPFEFMTEEDHEMVYRQAKTPRPETTLGIWDGQLVSDSAWTAPVFRFRYYLDGETLKNDYVFGGTLAGTAVVSQRADHLEMRDVTGSFHDELRQVDENTMIGKYYSDPNTLFQWLPEGLTFLHVDRTRTSVYLPYVLKRIGRESAFREYG